MHAPNLDGTTGTVAELLARAANRHADAPALLAPGRSPLSHGQLWHQSLEIGCELRRRGHGPTARVALALPPGPEMAAAFVAIAAHAGCVPLNPLAKAQELNRWFDACGVGAVVVARNDATPAAAVARERGLPVIEVECDVAGPAGRLRLHTIDAAAVDCSETAAPSDVTLVLQTSGTTGAPKVVELTNEALVACITSAIEAYQLNASDLTINVRPMYHVTGLVLNTLVPLASGGSVVCTSGFDGDLLFDWIARFRPTWFSGVTTMYQWWLAHADDYRRKVGNHRFRFLRAGSAAMPPATMRRIEALTGAPLIEAYGMTERAPIAANPLPPGQRKPGTVGRPCGVELALFDADNRRVAAGEVGEIAIRAPGLRMEPVGEHGRWFRTGDCGRLDEDGHLQITGRLKEMINRGGQKVAPREVEDQLLEHPAVAQAAAYAMPHPSLGEDVAAAVVAHPGAAIEPEQLRGFLLERLAAYKVPAVITCIETMPLGATGKVNRNALVGLCAHVAATVDEPPQGATEQRIAALFTQLLDGQVIGRSASFFAQGGDSISAARALSRLNEEFGIQLPATALFLHPNVATLAQQVDRLVRQVQDLSREIDELSDDEVAALLEREDARHA